MDSKSADIRYQNGAYRRGLVLGLTMAEIMVLNVPLPLTAHRDTLSSLEARAPAGAAMVREFKLDPKKRAAEKQASRDRDLERLKRGEITPEELTKENDFFAALDLAEFEIVSIGGRPFRGNKKKT